MAQTIAEEEEGLCSIITLPRLFARCRNEEIVRRIGSMRRLSIDCTQREEREGEGGREGEEKKRPLRMV
jgi:hypothetical protein